MERLFDADRRAYLLLHSRWRARWLDPIMVWATRAGTKGILWLALSVALFVSDDPHARWAALLTVSALLLAEGTINIALKPVIRRERPFKNRALQRLGKLLVDAPGPHSWPSAHAGSSVAAAVVLAYAYPRWSPIVLAAAVVIAHSRIYVGVHYPLDVLAGMLIGLLAATLALVVGMALRPL